MSILKRRILAALVDALIVALLELVILVLVGQQSLQHMATDGLKLSTAAGTINLTAGTPTLLLTWFVVGYLDGLFVFIQPLTILSLGPVRDVFSSVQGQIFLISLSSLIAHALYRVIAEFLPAHASVGMRLFKLKVDYQTFTVRQNPIVRHFAKILTMPVVVVATVIGVPLAHVFARSDDSDIGYYTRKLAGLDATEMLQDEVADVFIDDLNSPFVPEDANVSTTDAPSATGSIPAIDAKIDSETK